MVVLFGKIPVRLFFEIVFRQGFEVFEGVPHTFLPRNPGFPSEDFPCPAYVWLALHGIVLWQGFVYYLLVSPGEFNNFFRKFLNRRLMGVANI